MNKILSVSTKKILSPITLVVMVSLVGCGKYGLKSTGNTTKIIDPSQVELNAPSMNYLNIEFEENPDGNNTQMISAKQWLQAAQTFYKNKKYSRALRAAEESLILNDSEEAYRIAMLSAINITQSNIGIYNKSDALSDSEKQAIKDRLTKITTAINNIEYSDSKSSTD